MAGDSKADDSISTAMALLSAGKVQEAEVQLRAILVNQPDNAEALYGVGLASLDHGDATAAIELFKRAVGSDPERIDALAALGAAFIQAGFPAKATTVLAETVKRAPEKLEPRLHLAKAYTATGHLAESLQVLNDTATHFPHVADVWRLKGRAERRLEKFIDAYESLEKAADLDPDNAAIRNDFGVVCRALGNIEESIEQYRAAIHLSPELAIAHANLGNVLDLSGDLDGAEDALRHALELDPNTPDGTYNLACLLTKRERPEEALPFFEVLVASAPDRWDVQTNLGVTYLSLGNIDDAEYALRRAIELKPGNPEAHYNLAWLLLLTGRHEEGWAELEWRWHLPEFSSLRRTYYMPAWDGAQLKEGALYLHAEQGLGDTLQFIRFADDVKQRCSRIILGCQRPLIALASQIVSVDEIIPLDQIPPAAAAHAPLLSLPRLLNIGGFNIPHAEGYFKAPPIIEDHLRVPDTGKKRIGLVWAGSPDNKIEIRRKMDPALFLPLFDSMEADVVSLQVGPAARDIAVFPSDRITFSCDSKVTDFADTAAVISQLDLVIGVDTSVIHLSGAMGVPTWTILPFMPDYRWGLGTESTAWYAKMRLFRQAERGDWTAVIAHISDALSSW